MHLTKTVFSAAYLVTSKNSLSEKDFLKSTHFPNILFCFLFAKCLENPWTVKYLQLFWSGNKHSWVTAQNLTQNLENINGYWESIAILLLHYVTYPHQPCQKKENLKVEKLFSIPHKHPSTPPPEVIANICLLPCRSYFPFW